MPTVSYSPRGIGTLWCQHPAGQRRAGWRAGPDPGGAALPARPADVHDPAGHSADPVRAHPQRPSARAAAGRHRRGPARRPLGPVRPHPARRRPAGGRRCWADQSRNGLIGLGGMGRHGSQGRYTGPGPLPQRACGCSLCTSRSGRVRDRQLGGVQSQLSRNRANGTGVILYAGVGKRLFVARHTSCFNITNPFHDALARRAPIHVAAQKDRHARTNWSHCRRAGARAGAGPPSERSLGTPSPGPSMTGR